MRVEQKTFLLFRNRVKLSLGLTPKAGQTPQKEG